MILSVSVIVSGCGVVVVWISVKLCGVRTVNMLGEGLNMRHTQEQDPGRIQVSSECRSEFSISLWILLTDLNIFF